MMRTQLHEMVAGMAARRGDSPALTFKDTTVSYEELWSCLLYTSPSPRDRS